MDARVTRRTMGGFVLALALGLAGSIEVAAAAPVPDLAWTPPMVRTLDNGLTVAVFPRPRLPIVQAQLLVRAGTAAEPADAPGVATFTARLLTRGTTSRNTAAYSIEVDRLAGSVEASASRDFATLDGAFLARDLDSGIELMSDAVINPLFIDTEIQSLQSQAMAAIGAARSNPAVLADEQLWAAVYGDHPYARALVGTPASIASMNRERIGRFYQAQYRPQNAILAIAGDVVPEKAFASAEEWFGRWTVKGAASAAAALPAAAVPTTRLSIHLVDMPGAPTTQVRIGATAPAQGSDDEAAFTIANAIFGSTEDSRLARQGPGSPRVPGARSAYTILQRGGLFASAFSCANDSVEASVTRVRQALGRFAREPVAESELAPVRATAAQVFPMRFETLGGVTGTWSAATLGKTSSDPRDHVGRVAAVTPEQLTAVVRRWLDSDRLAIVAVGPAAVIQSQLERLGPVEVVSLGMGGSAATEAPRPATPEQQAQGRELVRQAVVAHGGAKLKRLKDSTVESVATVSVADRDVRGEVVQIRKEPDRMLVNMRFAGVTTIQAVLGNRGWTSSEASGEMRDMDTSQVASMKAGFGSDVVHVMLAASAPDAQPASRGRQNIGDQPADAVEVRSDQGPRVLYFDPRDHRLLAMDQQETAGGVSFTSRRLYRGYRMVQGIQWPYVEERQLDGRRVMLLEVSRVVLDSGVEDVVFERHGSLPPPPAAR